MIYLVHHYLILATNFIVSLIITHNRWIRWKQDLQNLFIATLMDQHNVRVKESLCKLQPARKSILKKEVAEQVAL